MANKTKKELIKEMTTKPSQPLFTKNKTGEYELTKQGEAVKAVAEIHNMMGKEQPEYVKERAKQGGVEIVSTKEQHAELVPKNKAEIVEVTEDIYKGISEKAFDKKAQDILQAPINPKDIDIRPDGLIYLSHAKVRQRLNEAFGAGAWSLRPLDKNTIVGNLMVRPFALYVNGRFVSEAIGEMKYIPSNSMMSYGDVAEGVKSNALTRLCKDIGIGLECWSKRYSEAWKKKYAENRNGKWYRKEN